MKTMHLFKLNYNTKQISYRLNDNYFNLTSSIVAVQEARVGTPRVQNSVQMLTLVQQHHLPHGTLTTATWVQFLLSPYWRMIRNTRFFPSYLLLWKNTQWTTRNDVFNYAGYSSFLGFDTRRLGMVSFALPAFCLVLPGLIMSLCPHCFIKERMLMAHHVAN